MFRKDEEEKPATPPPAPAPATRPEAKKASGKGKEKRPESGAPAPEKPRKTPSKTQTRPAEPAPPPPPPAEEKKRKGFSLFKKRDGADDAAAQPSAPATKPAPAAGAVEHDDSPKKKSLLARLREKLDGDAPPAVPMEKPERPEDWREHSVVTEDFTDFYSFGPSQAGGPDLRLSRGTVVRVLEKTRWGWARVRLLEGERAGYVGANALRAAEESDFRPPAPKPQMARSSGVAPQPWQPVPPPDLPDIPMAPGVEDGLLLLPPLEEPDAAPRNRKEPPLLAPGDALPEPGETPVPAPVEEPEAPEPVETPGTPAPSSPEAPPADEAPAPPSPPQPESEPEEEAPSAPEPEPSGNSESPS